MVFGGADGPSARCLKQRQRRLYLRGIANAQAPRSRGQRNQPSENTGMGHDFAAKTAQELGSEALGELKPLNLHAKSLR
ncbi:MAG TPA: hypothetical protein DCL54_18130 [Alphaproteobacteria bacterium]|nr:hypothetical protein [Alphaproteobacteria bacterium]HAJ48499.1 hypothetical protein [Alphaproteobacteria bacterium]